MWVCWRCETLNVFRALSRCKHCQAPRLTDTQERIYKLVQIRPRTSKELAAQIWWEHPLDAPNLSVIKAQVWHLNQQIKKIGQVVRANRGGNARFQICRYRLREL